jgi:Phosphorylase superfamily
VLDQRFIHLSPASVAVLHHGGQAILSLTHVYGGPVGTATVEELAYYGIEMILAYGLAGGLGTRGLAMGDFCLVAEAWAADGSTRHYDRCPVIPADARLCDEVSRLWTGPPLKTVRAATGDTIYRESDMLLDGYRAAGCDIVNLDSAHLYASARTNAEGRTLPVLQCGVITDVIGPGGAAAAESTLPAMLASGVEQSPLDRAGAIVRFYVETLIPRLMQR